MRWTTPFVALLVLAGVPAQADPAPQPLRQPVDANADGVVTREEAQSYPRLAAQFDAADTNKDGQLDAAERQALRQSHQAEAQARATQHWTAADADGDGAISREEAQKSMPRMSAHFDKIDANGDGKVERAEMHEFRMKRKGGWPNAADAT